MSQNHKKKNSTANNLYCLLINLLSHTHISGLQSVQSEEASTVSTPCSFIVLYQFRLYEVFKANDLLLYHRLVVF